MLESASAAGWTAPFWRVKAEGPAAVAALFGEGFTGKQGSYRIQSPHIAYRIRTGGFADGALVHQHDIIDYLMAQNCSVGTGLLYRALFEFADCHIENILNQ